MGPLPEVCVAGAEEAVAVRVTSCTTGKLYGAVEAHWKLCEEEEEEDDYAETAKEEEEEEEDGDDEDEEEEQVPRSH